MNEKVNDLLRRLLSLRSLTATERAFVNELSETLQNDCVVVNKKWITDNTHLVKTYSMEDGRFELTFEFCLRCLIHGYNDATIPSDKNFILTNYASERIIEMMEEGKDNG